MKSQICVIVIEREIRMKQLTNKNVYETNPAKSANKYVLISDS
jgi:hypothetical protein